MILAGIDEAGYGPTLGPLVVSVSVFRVPGEAGRASAQPIPDLWEMLSASVTRKPDGARTPVADSKKLFSQKKGLRNLEEGVLPFVKLKHGAIPRDLRALLDKVARRAPANDAKAASTADRYLEDYPWYRGRNVDLPIDTFVNVIEKRSELLRSALALRGVEILGLAAWPVEVLELNQGIVETESKAKVSFRAVGSFIRRVWKQFREEDVEVHVDRQGGRHHYGRTLFEAVRPKSIRIETETEDLSAYELLRKPSERSRSVFRVAFATECEERCLPVALASMLSKYLREAHMSLFNRFWREHRADLKPTAGYALDARRFLGDIGPLRSALGIDDATLILRR